ncbi:hypothetical protein ANTQUA_LOCUS501 [Anthophora quadrimaculata]
MKHQIHKANNTWTYITEDWTILLTRRLELNEVWRYTMLTRPQEPGVYYFVRYPMDRVRHCTGEMFHQRVSKDS